MNVFIIGGCHVGNYGVQPNLGFVQQWTNRLRVHVCEPVNVTTLSMIKIQHMPDLLMYYQSEVRQADVIVLQLGHYELSWRKRFNEIFHHSTQNEFLAAKLNGHCHSELLKPPIETDCSAKPFQFSVCNEVKDITKTTLLTLYRQVWEQLPCLNQFTDDLLHVFNELRPYQKKIVVMTPFPTLKKVDQWLRREGYPIIVKAAIERGFTVVDTFGAIPRQKSYFLADGVHLNSVGHLKVALCLHELSMLTNLFNEQFA